MTSNDDCYSQLLLMMGCKKPKFPVLDVPTDATRFRRYERPYCADTCQIEKEYPVLEGRSKVEIAYERLLNSFDYKLFNEAIRDKKYPVLIDKMYKQGYKFNT